MPATSSRRRALAGLAFLLSLIAIWWFMRTDDAAPSAIPATAPAVATPAPKARPAAVARAKAPEVPVVPPVPAAPAPTALTATVRDLADGSIATSIRILFGTADAVTPDASGVIALPDGATIGSAATTDAPFHVAGWTGDAPAKDGSSTPPTLWIYRDIKLSGVVTIESGTEKRPNCEVRCEIASGGMGIEMHELRDPFSLEWMRAHRVGHTTVSRTDETGAYEGVAPRVRGLAVVAQATSGLFRADVRRVEVHSAMTECRLDLRVVAARTIAGRVVLPPGAPIGSDVVVSIHVGRDQAFETVDPYFLSLNGQGVGLAGKRADGTPFKLTFLTGGQPSAAGEFKLPVYEDGDVLVVVDSDDYLPESRTLGWVADSRAGIVIELRSKGNRARVELAREGKCLNNWSVLVAEGDNAVGQSAHGPFKTGATGTFETGALELGHTYYLICTRDGGTAGSAVDAVSGWITWSGQTSLDLAKDLRPAR